MQQYEWFSYVRAILEIFYFASGVVLVIVAIRGLKQVKAAAEQVKVASDQLNLTREIATTNTKREAAKLAAEQCRYFADQLVPSFGDLIGKYKANHLTFLDRRLNPNEPQFVIQNGEFVKVNCDVALVQREIMAVQIEIIKYVNQMEYFAIVFASGVADEDIGYRETALAFCQGVEFCMAAFYHLRQNNMGRYDSTIKLYEIWSRRTAARRIAPFMTSMQALIKQAANDKIKVMGEA